MNISLSIDERFANAAVAIADIISLQHEDPLIFSEYPDISDAIELKVTRYRPLVEDDGESLFVMTQAQKNFELSILMMGTERHDDVEYIMKIPFEIAFCVCLFGNLLINRSTTSAQRFMRRQLANILYYVTERNDRNDVWVFLVCYPILCIL